MFEKLEKWIKRINRSIDELHSEISDLRVEVRTREPMYASRWYNMKYIPAEDLDLYDF